MNDDRNPANLADEGTGPHQYQALPVANPDPAVSRLKEVFGITDKELSAMVGIMTSDDQGGVMKNLIGVNLNKSMWDNISNIAKVVAYQGFDPRKVAASVVSKLVLYNGQELKQLKLDDTVCYYTEAATTYDIMFLITVFLLRGNSVAKIKATSDSAVGDVIARKASTYGIPLDPAKKLTSSSVTLARISQAFAPITATIIVGKGIPGKLRPKWLHTI